MVILFMLSILGFCLIVYQVKQVEADESPLLASCLMIILLYIAALVGGLAVGVYTVTALGLIMIPTVIILNRSDLKGYLKGLVTNPGFVVFVVLLGVLYPICKPIVTGAWDEYSHWALVVRNMLSTGQLPTPNGPVAPAFLVYPPASSLFQLLAMKLTGGPDGMMYYAQAVLLASCISMLLKGQSFKKPWLLIMALVLPILVMVKFSIHNIFNIFTDTIMAVVAITAFVSYYRSKRHLADMVKVIPILFVLCLIRSNAIIYGIFVVVLIAVDQIQKNGWKLKTLGEVATLLIPMVLAYGSWKLHILSMGIGSAGTSLFPVDVPRLITLLDNFKTTLFFTKLGTVYEPLTIASSTMAFTTMAVALMIVMHSLLKGKKEARRSFKVLGITFFMCFVIHTVTLIYAYQYIFSVQTSATLDSFHRYMGTFFMFWIIGIFAMMMTVLGQNELEKGRRRILTGLCALMIVVIAGLTHPHMLNIIGTRRLENPYEAESKACAQEIQDAIGTEAKVYMIFQKSRGYAFMGTRYELGTNPANLGTWSLGEPYSDGDTWTVDIKPEDLLQRFIDLEYEYVYIGNGDDQLWDNYGMLFEETGYKIYKVEAGMEPPLRVVATFEKQ